MSLQGIDNLIGLLNLYEQVTLWLSTGLGVVVVFMIHMGNFSRRR